MQWRKLRYKKPTTVKNKNKKKSTTDGRWPNLQIFLVFLMNEWCISFPLSSQSAGHQPNLFDYWITNGWAHDGPFLIRAHHFNGLAHPSPETLSSMYVHTVLWTLFERRTRTRALMSFGLATLVGVWLNQLVLVLRRGSRTRPTKVSTLNHQSWPRVHVGF